MIIHIHKVMLVFFTWYVTSISERGKIVNVHDQQLITQNAVAFATRDLKCATQADISISVH